MIILYLLVAVVDRLDRHTHAEILVSVCVLGRLRESGVNFSEGGEVRAKLTHLTCSDNVIIQCELQPATALFHLHNAMQRCAEMIIAGHFRNVWDECRGKIVAVEEVLNWHRRVRTGR